MNTQIYKQFNQVSDLDVKTQRIFHSVLDKVSKLIKRKLNLVEIQKIRNFITREDLKSYHNKTYQEVIGNISYKIYNQIGKYEPEMLISTSHEPGEGRLKPSDVFYQLVHLPSSESISTDHLLRWRIATFLGKKVIRVYKELIDIISIEIYKFTIPKPIDYSVSDGVIRLLIKELSGNAAQNIIQDFHFIFDVNDLGDRLELTPINNIIRTTRLSTPMENITLSFSSNIRNLMLPNSKITMVITNPTPGNSILTATNHQINTGNILYIQDGLNNVFGYSAFKIDNNQVLILADIIPGTYTVINKSKEVEILLNFGIDAS